MTTLYTWREENRTPASKARRFKIERLVDGQWRDVDWVDAKGEPKRFANRGDASWAILSFISQEELDGRNVSRDDFRIVPNKEEP